MTTWSEKMLQVLRRMNNFYSPGSSRTTCLRFEVGGEQVGWVPSKVASILSKFPEVFNPPHGGAITLCQNLDSYGRRSEAVDSVLQSLRTDGLLTVLKGWRDEKYEVMPRFCDTPLMCMERSATSLFGVKRYGVHINGYCQDENGELRMWVGRRSMTKQTYPGKLDNLAAGGLAAGIGVKNTLIKECEEEACIPEDIAETARPVSTVSYTYEDEEGVFPESQFVFDLELPPEFKPKIGDGEVQDFYLYSMDKVKELLISDDFKPNCAMVVLDFLIRHSYIQPDTVSQEVNCYSRFDSGNCDDLWLLGEVTMDDCCLNPHYGYIGADGKCKYCGPPSWSEWTAWGRCSVSCKEGVSQRRRECQGQGKCAQTTIPREIQKLALETKVCIDSNCCPEQGQWSKWGQWQPCSVTCNKGVRNRVRTCTEPQPRCGGSCDGPSEEKEPCVIDRICPTHGGWSNWESWQPCSGTCGGENLPRPTQRRNRSCNNPPPSSVPPGDECPGLGSNTRTCDELPFCPVNGNWGQWGPPSSCSVTCGVGIHEMLRQCNNPAPKHGGLPCSGSNKDQKICNTKHHCPVDGQWSQWGKWEECKSNRGKIRCRKIGGQQRRQRWCEHTGFDGKTCEGQITDYRACYDITFCDFDGKWSEWSEWSQCEPPCGEGAKMTRERKCLPDLSKYDETVGFHIKVKAYFEGKPFANCTLLKDPKQSLACMNVPPCDT